jgi:hypothetical protein
MSEPKVALGTFVFQGLEVPNRIVLRNKEKLLVHRLTSGDRAIGAAGTDTQTITFRGIFTGSDASGRIDTLDEMRRQGAPLRLRWDFQIADVLIQDFELFHESYRWIPYRLVLQVLDDASAASSGDPDLPWPMPAAQISDIDTLLSNTPLSLPSGLRAAVVRLAGGNYDVAPADALTSLRNFLSDIDQAIDTSRIVPASDIDLGDGPGLTASFGVQACLRLSRNRIEEIAVKASQSGDTR